MGLVASFLIVEHDVRRAKVVAKGYSELGRIKVVRRIAHAAREMQRRPWTGLVLDSELPDGSGLEFLHRLIVLEPMRQRLDAGHAIRSVLVSSKRSDFQRPLGPAPFFTSIVPRSPEPLRHGLFARQAIAAEHVRTPMALLVADVAQQHQLSAMHTRILALQVGAIPRREWVRTLRVSDNTLKTHARRLCKYTGARSVAALAAPIIRATMQRDDP